MLLHDIVSGIAFATLLIITVAMDSKEEKSYVFTNFAFLISAIKATSLLFYDIAFLSVIVFISSVGWHYTGDEDWRIFDATLSSFFVLFISLRVLPFRYISLVTVVALVEMSINYWFVDVFYVFEYVHLSLVGVVGVIYNRYFRLEFIALGISSMVIAWILMETKQKKEHGLWHIFVNVSLYFFLYSMKYTTELLNTTENKKELVVKTNIEPVVNLYNLKF